MALSAAQRQRTRRARMSQDDHARENEGRSTRRRKARRDPANTAFVFYDGECSDDTFYDYIACTIFYQGAWEDKRLYRPGEHINLLAAIPFLEATRRYCRKTLGAKHVEFVAFSFAYDADQLIGHLPVSDELKYKLSRQCTGSWGAKRTVGWERDIRVGAYKVYLGKKTWEFSRILTKADGTEIAIRPLRVHDFFTLHATSFLNSVVSTCSSLLPTLTEAQHSQVVEAIETVKIGKAARGTFADNGMTPDDVHTYNMAEGILATLYIQNYYALCSSHNLYPRSPAGPAPLARAAMKANGAHKHVKPDFWDTLDFHAPNGLYQKINMSFFGGRIETLGQGVVETLHEYDVNSAYPSEQTKLPCLAHGQFALITDPDEVVRLCTARYPWAIYLVSYASDKDAEIGPFPVRTMNEGVCFPLNGHKVWVTAPEVYAFDTIANERTGFDLMGWEALIWLPECDIERPFAYLEEFYQERLALKRQHDPRQQPLKLASNSTYGVLAQRAGNYIVVDEAGSVVEIHTSNTANLFGAALTTGGIRARLYTAAMAAPAHTVVQFATDSVKATVPLNLPISEDLGGWSYDSFHNVAVIQPGLTLDSEGKCIKTRGVSRSAFKARYEDICAAWEAHEDHITVTVHEYHTLRDCLHKSLQGEYTWSETPWGVFEDMQRQTNIAPSAIASKRVVGAASSSVQWTYYPPYPTVKQGRRASQIARNIAEEFIGLDVVKALGEQSCAQPPVT